jgi:hypothetical protein
VEVALADLVVTGTHVGGTVDELDVEVLVVVLLEFTRLDSVEVEALARDR